MYALHPRGRSANPASDTALSLSNRPPGYALVDPAGQVAVPLTPASATGRNGVWTIANRPKSVCSGVSTYAGPPSVSHRGKKA